jgi:hypothetical protein
MTAPPIDLMNSRRCIGCLSDDTHLAHHQTVSTPVHCGEMFVLMSVQGLGCVKTNLIWF